MAGYSENRELNYEIKYMRKRLAEVDDRILVPDSIRGAALRQKLDSIQPDQEPRPNTRTGLRLVPRMLTVRSGLTCAAAFALIVSLFYGLQGQGLDLINGSVPIQDDATAGEAEMAPAAFSLEHDAVEDGEPMSGGGEPRFAAEITAEAPVDADAGGEDDAALRNTPAVGGVRSRVLSRDDEVTYSYRNNEPTDPDKANYPITVDIVDTESEQLLGQVDIPDMESVETFYANDDSIAVVGRSASGVITRTYNVQNASQPAEQLVVEQQGTLQASGALEAEDTVYTVTRLDDADGGAQSVTPLELPDCREGASGYLITAVDLSGSQPTVSQRKLEGAILSVETRGQYAVVTYEGADESGETELMTAQVLLSGEGIALSSAD